MTELDAELAQLANMYGQQAQFSEYRRGDSVSYRTPSGTYHGLILYVAAPSESHVEGHEPLKLRYIIARTGWEGFPDVCYSTDILGLYDLEEPVLVPCPYCKGHHYIGTVELCPLNPNQPSK